MQKKDFSTYYVCDKCFRRFDDCTCPSVPQRMIVIDPGIQDLIRILNEKGWTTQFCCEGHYTPGGQKKGHYGGYITFAEAQTVPPYFPNGITYSSSSHGSHSMYWDIVCTSKIPEKRETQFRTAKENWMKDLLLWAESLPENANKERR